MNPTSIQPSADVPLGTAHGWSVSVEQLGNNGWHEISSQFEDASLHQSWAMGAARWGRNNLYHAWVTYNGVVKAAAQIAVRNLGPIGISAAYVSWGPIWKRRDGARDLDAYSRLITALRHRFVDNSGLLLALMPTEADGEAGVHNVLVSRGFRHQPQIETYETLAINPSLPEIELQSALSQSWRRNLKKSNRHEFEIIVSDDGSGFEEFRYLYAQMKLTKTFKDSPVMTYLDEIEAQLPKTDNLRVYLARHNGVAVAGVIVWLSGVQASRQLAAATLEARNLRAAFHLDWHIVRDLGGNNITHYDLCGIDPLNNPGVYQYKLGLSGDLGKRIELPGQYWAYRNRIVQSLAHAGLRLRYLKQLLS